MGRSLEEGKDYPLQYSGLENSTDCIAHGVATSQTQLSGSSFLSDFWIIPIAQTVKKNLPAMQETRVQFLGGEDPLQEGTATHSSILAWRIPWTEEPGGHSPWGRRVGHDRETNTTEENTITCDAS